MTELLDVRQLQPTAVNRVSEEPRRRTLTLHWIIDLRTQRPVGYWTLEAKPVLSDARLAPG
jgi:hypothetical protein